MRCATLLLLSSIFLLFAFTSCGDTVESSDPTVTPQAEPATERETPTPAPTAHAFAVYGPPGGTAVASLEERIYVSDVVVVARFLSASGDRLRFRAIEYLKGTGASEFTVRATGQNTQQSGQQSVLFLTTPESGGGSGASINSATGTAPFDFTDTTTWDWDSYATSSGRTTSYAGNRPEGYDPSSNNPVWLPVESSSSIGGAVGGASSSSTDIVLIEVTPGGATPCSQDGFNFGFRDFCTPTVATSSLTASLAELRAKVAWVGGGGGNQRYSDCVLGSLGYSRYARDWEAYHGTRLTKNSFEGEIDSGKGAGEEVNVYPGGWPGKESAWTYHKMWITGEHADLFSIRIVDDDTIPSNGSDDVISTTRPLPQGTYRFTDHLQKHFFIPCDFIPFYTGLNWTVTVTAPAGTLHEAFFDPIYATSTGEYKADASLGVLKPAGYRKAGANATTTISSIAWKSQKATLTLGPLPLPPENHHIDFIALDGSVKLRLDIEDATRGETVGAYSYTWGVCAQPWKAGDLLMLRIAQRPANLTGATNDTSCATPTPTPVATSTPPVATSTPIATSTPPVATSTPPVATSTPPVATSTPPVATSTPPVATTTPPVATSTPIATSTPTPEPTPPPAPPQVAGFQVTSSGGGSISLSWQSRDGIARYQLDYMARGGNWRMVSDSLTGTSHTESGLPCGGREQFFRIRAYGDGATYAAQWGAWTNLAHVMPC